MCLETKRNKVTSLKSRLNEKLHDISGIQVGIAKEYIMADNLLLCKFDVRRQFIPKDVIQDAILDYIPTGCYCNFSKT